ncbi:GrpB family protein [Facklamia sp. DSM 111018]|uniref:GrpB family protein n=1 Tax=Facklamia lactis TaxID=2749967 RepID=A0ABS0LTE0_9LACT|nr:GrpB family protein [Facklamia lactis]MBG9987294.1 GrpB family protein [Facklamia lactis]
MPLGVQRGEVVLSEYQESWVEDFNKVKNEILKVLEIKPEYIQHVGSTSINGLCAKPIIDILIGVDDYKKMPESFFESLKSIGIYRLRVEKEDEIVLAKFEDESFQKHTHFVHLVNLGGQKCSDLIAFRDFLRSHKESRAEYMDLKMKLSEEFSKDRPKYTEAKAAFIQSIINHENRNKEKR